MKWVLAVFLILLTDLSVACVSPADNSTYTASEDTVLCNSDYMGVKIRLNADNILLDCNNSVLDGLNKSISNNHGIEILDAIDGTTVANCHVKNYQQGYRATHTDWSVNDYVLNSTFENNSRAIYNLNNYYLNIINNSFTGDDYGLYLASANYYLIENNTFARERYSAVYLSSLSSIRYTKIRKNSFISNANGNGVVEVSSQLTDSAIEYNVFMHNNYSAVSTGSSLAVTRLNVSYNNITNNTNSAFQFFGLEESRVIGNLINLTSSHGMRISQGGCRDSIVENNTILGRNLLYGILLELYADNITVRGNYIGNYNQPLFIQYSENNHIYNNIFNISAGTAFNMNDTNLFNTSDCSRENIMGGPCLGGNFWADTSGTGFSETCDDGNADGFCDAGYDFAGGSDLLPLVRPSPALAISLVSAISITNQSSLITWTTNIASNSTVSYGLTGSLGQAAANSSLVTSHTINLTGMMPGTLYYYNVTSCTNESDCRAEGLFQFTTLPLDFVNLSLDYSDWLANETTNLSAYSVGQLSNISNVTFSNTHGRILYIENLNLTTDRNLTDLIKIMKHKAWVNSSLIPEFNKGAKLTFRNVTLSRPIIKRDNTDCISCTGNTFDSIEKTYEVNVTGFSVYELVEQCSDGMENYDETGIDCGGSCSACPSYNNGGSGGRRGGGRGGALAQPRNLTLINASNQTGQEGRLVNETINVEQNTTPGIAADNKTEEGPAKMMAEDIAEKPLKKTYALIPAIIVITLALGAAAFILARKYLKD